VKRNVWISNGVAAVAAAIFVAVVPAQIASSEARSAGPSPAEPALNLAQGVASYAKAQPSEAQYGTGSALFDGEWLFGTFMMAAMGHGQLARADLAGREKHLANMEAALDAMLGPRGQAFDAQRWGEAPLAPGGAGTHAAYLGYANLALSLHRSLRPASRFASHNDQVSARLEQLLEARATVAQPLLETYPGEWYPVDNAAVLASVTLRRQVLSMPLCAAATRLSAALENRYIQDGLLVQATGPDGNALDSGRGSGTFLGSYFLSLSDPALSRKLYESGKRALYRQALGFGAMREYPDGHKGSGDIDSGPIALGLGVSSTGFAMGAARAHGDAQVFERTYATAHLFGAPKDSARGRHYATGGPIGDAILFAMTTALPVGGKP
jgi:hypothetical protein